MKNTSEVVCILLYSPAKRKLLYWHKMHWRIQTKRSLSCSSVFSRESTMLCWYHIEKKNREKKVAVHILSFSQKSLNDTMLYTWSVYLACVLPRILMFIHVWTWECEIEYRPSIQFIFLSFSWMEEHSVVLTWKFEEEYRPNIQFIFLLFSWKSTMLY